MSTAEDALKAANAEYSLACQAWQASQAWNVAGLTPEERVEQDWKAEKLFVSMRAAWVKLDQARRAAIRDAVSGVNDIMRGQV